MNYWQFRDSLTLLSHSTMKDVPHICNICGVSVMKSVIARHMKTHDEVPQFRCEICDNIYISC